MDIPVVHLRSARLLTLGPVQFAPISLPLPSTQSISSFLASMQRAQRIPFMLFGALVTSFIPGKIKQRAETETLTLVNRLLIVLALATSLLLGCGDGRSSVSKNTTSATALSELTSTPAAWISEAWQSVAHSFKCAANLLVCRKD